MTSKQIRAQRSRHKVNFLNSADLEAVCLAQLGLSNRAIEIATGLTDGKINYRLRKAAVTEGIEGGYRQRWRDGTSEHVRSLVHAVVPNMKKDLRKELSPHFVAREAQISPNGS